jgi:hypothetical protein
MIPIEEILSNLRKALDMYNNLPLFEVRQLSEVLKMLDVNLGALVEHRIQAHQNWQSIKFNSKAKSEAAKKSEADFQCQELYKITHIMKEYGDIKSSIRSQISLHKKND